MIKLHSFYCLVILSCLAKTRSKSVHSSYEDGWSEWSECSRSCDGGVSNQTRLCDSDGCDGHAADNVRYKICNMQSCEDATDFRDWQCSAYDAIPYKGELLTWRYYHHPKQLCSLTCVNQFGDVAALAPAVLDGTRCRPGSLDMCIKGVCRVIGCDLEIGSAKKLDACGVCGGDGTSCTQAMYQWNQNTNTSCSVKCGGGYKITQPVCQNSFTGEVVNSEMCDLSRTPKGILLECNSHPCPPRWETGEWSVCSEKCGGGIRTRVVNCVEQHNQTSVKVFDRICKSHKPRNQESCNTHACPSNWIVGPWSPCSTNCGQGIQFRNVTCPNFDDASKCDSYKKPRTEQSCKSLIFCSGEKFDPEKIKRPGIFRNKEVNPFRLSSENFGITKYPYAVYIAEEWGPCSENCGEGIKKRKVHCTAYLDYSKMTTKFSDDACVGEKPAEVEPCFNDICAAPEDTFRDDSSVQDVSKINGEPGKTGYSWQKNGYTPCSATCLGGIQELIINCVRDDDGKVVSPYLCDRAEQPEEVTQTCNEHACPPRWNVTDFSDCDRPCGGGNQYRGVSCIHQITATNTIVVPSYMCTQQAPVASQSCNEIDCPAKWIYGNWTKCSKPCGGGIKTRTVECQQITADNLVIILPDDMCPGKKPSEVRECNIQRTCTNERNEHFEQMDPANSEVSLKIGGRAIIFSGTRIKIRCPVGKTNKEHIIWTKDHDVIATNKNYKISKRGILKIMDATYKDSGLYTCTVGDVKKHIDIIIRSRINDVTTSKENFYLENQADSGGYQHTLSTQQIYDSTTSQTTLAEIDSSSAINKTNIVKVTTTAPAKSKSIWSLKEEIVDSLLPSSAGMTSKKLLVENSAIIQLLFLIINCIIIFRR